MVKTILKLIFASCLIYWLVKNGKLDFSLFNQSSDYPINWVLCFLFIMFNMLLGSFRWMNILNVSTKIKITFLNVIKINWIGFLFNMFLPGAVSGDFVKLLYVKKIDSTLNRRFLLTTVIIDRILGLCGLIIILGLANLFILNQLNNYSETLKILILFNYFLVIGVVFFLLILFLNDKNKEKVTNLFSKIPFLGKQINKLMSELWMIGSNKKLVFQSILISMTGQSFYIMGLWVISLPFIEAITLKFAFSLLPLGFISMAIPLTPAGIGVGHVVFDKLYEFYNYSNGASIFNLFFMAQLLINLMGIIPYILSEKILINKNELTET